MEVSEVIEVNEVSDNRLAGGNASGKTNVDRSTSGRLQGKNSERSDNFNRSSSARFRAHGDRPRVLS